MVNLGRGQQANMPHYYDVARNHAGHPDSKGEKSFIAELGPEPDAELDAELDADRELAMAAAAVSSSDSDSAVPCGSRFGSSIELFENNRLHPSGLSQLFYNNKG